MEGFRGKHLFSHFQEERKKVTSPAAAAEFPFPFHVDATSQESLDQLDQFFQSRSYVQVIGIFRREGFSHESISLRHRDIKEKGS
jgi:hypothetical protein